MEGNIFLIKVIKPLHPYKNDLQMPYFSLLNSSKSILWCLEGFLKFSIFLTGRGVVENFRFRDFQELIKKTSSTIHNNYLLTYFRCYLYLLHRKMEISCTFLFISRKFTFFLSKSDDKWKFLSSLKRWDDSK